MPETAGWKGKQAEESKNGDQPGKEGMSLPSEKPACPRRRNPVASASSRDLLFWKFPSDNSITIGFVG
jgi:hypothetical protein